MLESTRGRHARLADFRDRAVVVFHESRGHRGENEALKQWCGRASTQASLRDRLTVLGVANLHGLGWGAARKLVTAAVRMVAAGYGVELWMDFDRVFDLEDGAHVLVIAPGGEVLFRGSGPLDPGEQARFANALAIALGRARIASAA